MSTATGGSTTWPSPMPPEFDLLPITVRVRYATGAREEAMVDGVPYMARMMGVADLTHARFPLGRRAGVGRDDRGARRSSAP